MIGSMKKRRIERERFEAVGERDRAARDFVSAVREAEAALDALKEANDKLYRGDTQAEQASLNELRNARERMFAFTVAKEVAAEAPRLTRALGVRVAPTQAMPLVEYIAHTSALDLSAGGATVTPINGAQP